MRAELSSLQGQLATIQRENAQFAAEISAVCGAVGTATGALVETNNHISSTLQTGTSRLANAHATALSTQELQGEISWIYERLKRMELANKRIRELQNKRYYEFKTYRQVRKIVQGVMDNLDFNMVSLDLIEKAIEKNHLQTPDYWLTCVLLAVVSWMDGSRERAQRALDQALQLDKKRTAAFLLIFNLRMGRDEAAIKWFSVLKDMELVGADKSMVLLFFSLLSRTIKEAVSEGTRQKVIGHVRRLIDQSMTDVGVGREETIARMEKLMVGMCSESAFEYPLMVKHCPAWTSFWSPLVLARNNEKLIGYYGDIMNVTESATNEFLKVYIDEVVAAPSGTEQGVYDEIERNENIISFQGDVDAAEAAWASSKSEAVERLDVVSKMLHWVYDPVGSLEANPQMRLSMFTLMKDLQITSASRYIEHYRAAFVTKTEVVVDGFSVNADLQNIAAAKSEATAYCNAKCAEDQAAVKDVSAYVAMAAGVALAVAAYWVGPALLAVAALAVVGGFGFIFYNKKEREKISLKWDSITANMQSTLDELGAEFTQYAAEYAEWDMLSDRMLAQLEAL